MSNWLQSCGRSQSAIVTSAPALRRADSSGGRSSSRLRAAAAVTNAIVGLLIPAHVLIFFDRATDDRRCEFKRKNPRTPSRERYRRRSHPKGIKHLDRCHSERGRGARMLVHRPECLALLQSLSRSLRALLLAAALVAGAPHR